MINFHTQNLQIRTNLKNTKPPCHKSTCGWEKQSGSYPPAYPLPMYTSWFSQQQPDTDDHPILSIITINCHNKQSTQYIYISHT